MNDPDIITTCEHMMALLSVGSVNGMFRVVICSQYTLELTIIVSFYTAVIRLDVVSIM